MQVGPTGDSSSPIYGTPQQPASSRENPARKAADRVNSMHTIPLGAGTYSFTSDVPNPRTVEKIKQAFLQWRPGAGRGAASAQPKPPLTANTAAVNQAAMRGTTASPCCPIHCRRESR